MVRARDGQGAHGRTDGRLEGELREKGASVLRLPHARGGKEERLEDDKRRDANDNEEPAKGQTTTRVGTGAFIEGEATFTDSHAALLSVRPPP